MVAGGSSEQFAAAVDAIYAAAVAPDGWPAALMAFAAAFDDAGAGLSYRREDGQFDSIVSPGLTDALRDYEQCAWHRHDIRAMRADERGFFALRDVVTDEHLVSAEEMATHPFYTDFLARFGLRWSAWVNISPAPGVTCVISIQRTAAKSAFTRAEQQLLLRLGRHAENALRLSGRHIGGEAVNGGVRERLGRLGMGVFLLDRYGRVVFANTAGHRLLGDGIAVLNARLTSSGASQRAAFDLAVDSAVRGAQRTMVPDPKPVLLPRLSSGRPLVSHFLPMRSLAGVEFDASLAQAEAGVIVVESEDDGAADPAVLRDLLGLTLGEARIAAMAAAGIPPREASKRLRISEGVAQAALNHAFTRMGVGRVSELMSLLAGAAGPAAPFMITASI